jgi:glutamate racemase
MTSLSSLPDLLQPSLHRVATAELSNLPGNALLGLFDSGLGGLTVLRRLMRQRPGQPCVYVGDTARVPYGGRSPGEIREIAAEVVSWLRSQGAQALVMACNTTNAVALDVAQAEAGVPVLGLIESVAGKLDCQRVGVLATPATAGSGAYGRAFRQQRQRVSVVEIGCPLFVPAVERHDLNSPTIRAAAAAYLEPLLQAKVEAVVMGCTHYPLLEPLLRSLLPPDVLLVDPAQAVVDLLLTMLPTATTGDAAGDALAACSFYSSGDADAFSAAATYWLGHPVSARRVNLQA